MKFDYIIGNPPYIRGLHIKISVRSFFNLKDLGELIFIQPGTMFFNKNKKPREYEKKYKEIIQSFYTEAEIVPGSIFEKEAGFLTSLSITKIKKEKSKNKLIEKIKYQNGKEYDDVRLENISFTQIPPNIYEKIRIKCETFIEKQGSIDTLKNQLPGISVSFIRGNVCQESGKLMSNFYSIYSPINYKTGFITNDYIFNNRNNPNGKVKNYYTIGCIEKESENIYDYLQKKMPQICQALYKYSSQTPNFKYIPLVDFSRCYSEDELYEMVGFSKKEIKEIENVIVEYDPRKKPKLKTV
jgi:hypothetical protein